MSPFSSQQHADENEEEVDDDDDDEDDVDDVNDAGDLADEFNHKQKLNKRAAVFISGPTMRTAVFDLVCK